MASQTAPATPLVSKTYQDVDEQAAFNELAERLAVHLKQPVIPFAIDQPHQSLANILGDLLRYGISNIVTLPIFLNSADYHQYAVADTVAHVNRRWPFVEHHIGSPLDWTAWLRLLQVTVGAAMRLFSHPDSRVSETAFILVGHSDSHAEANGDLAKLARLFSEVQLWATASFDWTDVAFISQASPTVSDLITRYQRLRAWQIFIAPFLLFPGQAYHQLRAQVDAAQSNGINHKSNIEIAFCFSTYSSRSSSDPTPGCSRRSVLIASNHSRTSSPACYQ